MIVAILREARPKQWLKNVLVFAAPAALGDVSLTLVSRSMIVFVAFCLTASGTYFWNDIKENLTGDGGRHWHRVGGARPGDRVAAVDRNRGRILGDAGDGERAGGDPRADRRVVGHRLPGGGDRREGRRLVVDHHRAERAGREADDVAGAVHGARLGFERHLAPRHARRGEAERCRVPRGGGNAADDWDS